MAKNVVIWHVTVDCTQIYDINKGPNAVMQIHTDVNPLSLEFDIDHTLSVDPKSIKATYQYASTLKFVGGGQVMEQDDCKPTGKSVKAKWATVGRNLRPCGGADPY